MKTMRIDHIHIKVENVEKAAKMYESILGKYEYMIDFTDKFGVKLAYNSFPKGLILTEVTDPDKGEGKIYKDMPLGLTAISLKVEDISEANEKMKNMGYQILNVNDMGGLKQVMFDTKEDMGFNIELVESDTDDIADAENTARKE